MSSRPPEPLGPPASLCWATPTSLRSSLRQVRPGLGPCSSLLTVALLPQIPAWLAHLLQDSTPTSLPWRLPWHLPP